MKEIFDADGLDRRAQSITAGVDEDPVEPLIEPRRVTQRRPLPPRLDQRVVGGILRLSRVAQDRASQTIGGVEAIGRPGAGRPAARSVGCSATTGPTLCHLEDLG